MKRNKRPEHRQIIDIGYWPILISFACSAEVSRVRNLGIPITTIPVSMSLQNGGKRGGGGPFTSPGFNHRTPPWIPYTLYYWSLQLVVELPVLILAEECGSDAGKGVRFKHAQPLFECIVEFDLAAAAVEKDTSSSGELVSSCFFGIQ